MQVKMSEKCRAYLTKHILPLQTKWASYSTGQLTNFGSHSTQLVESLNRLIKMWDVNDRTSLSQAIARICTVKEEEETKKQITAMRDYSAAAAAGVEMFDTYKTKIRKFLTGAAATLCEAEHDLYSQYKISPGDACGLFSLATQVYIVQHKQHESSQYQVHVSPSLVYCPCGHCFTYLLPCRHILAANGVAFADIFQPAQYHPRWRLLHSAQMQQELLSTQFWLSAGSEVTRDGLLRVQLQGTQREEEEAAAAASAPNPLQECPALPDPMYGPSHLVPASVTPQHLYHLIEGEYQELRQLACANPVMLSGMVFTGLRGLRVQVATQIGREQRTQQHYQHAAATAAAAASGSVIAPSSFTSEGVPLSSLLAPVPITAAKAGRPSNKRSRAAAEGVTARKVQAMLPASLVGGGSGSRGGGGRSNVAVLTV